jgi:hypothetical protein
MTALKLTMNALFCMLSSWIVIYHQCDSCMVCVVLLQVFDFIRDFTPKPMGTREAVLGCAAKDAMDIGAGCIMVVTTRGLMSLQQLLAGILCRVVQLISALAFFTFGLLFVFRGCTILSKFANFVMKALCIGIGWIALPGTQI